MMNRLKALYRSWAIPCAGQQVYAPRHRAEWLAKISRSRRAPPGGVLLSAARRVAVLCVSKCGVICWRRAESTSATKLLRQIPSIGPIRAALLIALIQTPHRFRTKRQLWAYSGLALKTSTSGEYRFVEGQLKRSKKTPGDPRAQRQPQSRSEKYLQGCGHPSRWRSGTVPGVLRRSSCPRDETVHGTPHPGAQDCGDHFAGLEERSAFRRRTSETTSSLSVCREPIHPWIHLRRWPVGSSDALVRG